MVTIQANGWGDLEAAVADLQSLAGAFCSGAMRVAVADASNPRVEL